MPAIGATPYENAGNNYTSAANPKPYVPPVQKPPLNAGQNPFSNPLAPIAQTGTTQYASPKTAAYAHAHPVGMPTSPHPALSNEQQYLRTSGRAGALSPMAGETVAQIKQAGFGVQSGDLLAAAGMLLPVDAVLGAAAGLLKGGRLIQGALDSSSVTGEIGAGSRAAGEMGSGSRVAGELGSGSRARFTAGRNGITDLADQGGVKVLTNAKGDISLVNVTSKEIEVIGKDGKVVYSGARDNIKGFSGIATDLSAKGYAYAGVVIAADAAGGYVAGNAAANPDHKLFHITPRSSTGVYKTITGDTVASVAAANGLTVKQLENLNPSLKGKQTVPKGTEILVDTTNLPPTLSAGEYTALANQATNDEKAAKKDKSAVEKDKKELNKLHSEYGAARAAGDKSEIHRLGIASIEEERKLKNDLAGQNSAESAANHIKSSLGKESFNGSTDLSAKDITSLKEQQAADLATAAKDKFKAAGLQTDLTKLEGELKFAQASGDQALVNEIRGKINHDKNAIAGDEKAAQKADNQAYHIGKEIEKNGGTAGGGVAATGHTNSDVNSIKFTDHNDKTSIEDILKKYNITRQQFNEKNPNLAGQANGYTLPQGDSYRVPTVSVDEHQLKQRKGEGSLGSSNSEMPVSASTGSNQPGLGMAPGSKLSDYPGSHVSHSSGALVDADKLSSNEHIGALMNRFHENWPMFEADNPELAKKIGKDGTIEKGTTVFIRADKYKEFTSSGGVPASTGSSPAGSTPASSHTSGDPKPGDKKSTDGGPPVPSSMGTEPTLGMAPNTTPSDYPGSHIDNTSGARVETETASGNVRVEKILQESGESWPEFYADNHEYTKHGTVEKGHKFQIRAQRAKTYELNAGISEGSLGGSFTSGPVTIPSSGGAPPPPPPAPAKPPTSNPAGPTAPPASVPIQDPFAAPQKSSDPTPESVGVEHADGRPGLGMDPGTNLESYGYGKGLSHVDKTSKALVETETAPAGNITAKDVYTAAGENWAEFSADNREYTKETDVVGGKSFQIRANHVYEYEHNRPVPGSVITPTNNPAPVMGSLGNPNNTPGTFTNPLVINAGTPPVAPTPDPTPAPPPTPQSYGIAPGGANQPGLGMAPNTNLDTYRFNQAGGSHVDSTSNALVVGEIAPAGMTAQQAYTDAHENWAEFSADNKQFTSPSQKIGGRGFQVRADKANTYSSNTGGGNPFPSNSSYGAAIENGSGGSALSSLTGNVFEKGGGIEPMSDPVNLAVVQATSHLPKTEAIPPKH